MFPRSGLAGSKAKCIYDFPTTSKFLPIRIVTFFIPTAMYWRACLSHGIPPTLSNTWVLAHLLDVEWQLCVVFICLLLLQERLTPNTALLSGDIPSPFCLLCISLPISSPLILRWVLLIHGDNIQNTMIMIINNNNNIIPNISLYLCLYTLP